MVAVFGYDRVLLDEPPEDVERQAECIREKAWALDLNLSRVRIDVGPTVNRPFNERLEFKKLIAELEPRDHLFVWRLHRLESIDHRLHICLQWMVNRRLTLHVLNIRDGESIDLMDTRDVSALREIFTDIFATTRKQSVGQATGQARIELDARGLAGFSSFRFGRKRIELPNKYGREYPPKVDIWNQQELAQIAELYIRFRGNGESRLSIWRDWVKRGVDKTANGQPWARPLPGSGRPDVERIRRVIRWYEQILQDDECPPELDIPAVRAAWEKWKKSD